MKQEVLDGILQSFISEKEVLVEFLQDPIFTDAFLDVLFPNKNDTIFVGRLKYCGPKALIAALKGIKNKSNDSQQFESNLLTLGQALHELYVSKHIKLTVELDKFYEEQVLYFINNATDTSYDLLESYKKRTKLVGVVASNLSCSTKLFQDPCFRDNKFNDVAHAIMWHLHRVERSKSSELLVELLKILPSADKNGSQRNLKYLYQLLKFLGVLLNIDIVPVTVDYLAKNTLDRWYRDCLIRLLGDGLPMELESVSHAFNGLLALTGSYRACQLFDEEETDKLNNKILSAFRALAKGGLEGYSKFREANFPGCYPVSCTEDQKQEWLQNNDVRKFIKDGKEYECFLTNDPDTILFWGTHLRNCLSLADPDELIAFHLTYGQFKIAVVRDVTSGMMVAGAPIYLFDDINKNPVICISKFYMASDSEALCSKAINLIRDKAVKMNCLCWRLVYEYRQPEDIVSPLLLLEKSASDNTRFIDVTFNLYNYSQEDSSRRLTFMPEVLYDPTQTKALHFSYSSEEKPTETVVDERRVRNASPT